MDHEYETFITYEADTDRTTIQDDMRRAIDEWAFDRRDTRGIVVDERDAIYDPTIHSVNGSILGRNIDRNAIQELFDKIGTEWLMTFEIEIEWLGEKMTLYRGTDPIGLEMECGLHQLGYHSLSLVSLMRKEPEQSQLVIRRIATMCDVPRMLEAIEWLTRSMRETQENE